MTETALNAMAKQYEDLTLCKSRYDELDIQWYTEGPFWRRTNMRFSRDYKLLPDYEIADAKHGRTLQDIYDESEHLLENLKLYQKTAQPRELRRTQYLIDHLGHLHARTAMLLGESMSYDTMTDRLYNLVAPAYPHQEFDTVLEELNQALPGQESVQNKIQKFKAQISIPQESLLTVLEQTTLWFHNEAMKRMSLTGNSMPRVRVREFPSEEMEFLSILFAYDYYHLEYERNFNLRFPWRVDSILACIGHEMEPGHITYYEKRLQAMIDTCWPEMSIVSQFSSSSAFTEGASRYVIELCFDSSMKKQMEFEREFIFKPAGLDLALTELMPLWHRYCEISGYGKLEATRNVWDGIWSKEEATAFLKNYAFVGQEADASCVDRLSADEGHFVSHDYARDVIKEYFLTVTSSIEEQWRLYEQLCSAHMSMREIKDKTFKISF